MKFRILLIACLLLNACATQKNATVATADWSKTTWREQGVFSYRDAHQSFLAAYIWQNNKNTSTIQVIGPLGAWRAQLLLSQQGVQLTNSDGKILRAKDSTQLMEKFLGWSIPVDYLRYWLSAQPAPETTAVVRHGLEGSVSEIQQAGWCVRYVEYQNFANNRLPEKITLSQGDKAMTLVIQKFELS